MQGQAVADVDEQPVYQSDDGKVAYAIEFGYLLNKNNPTDMGQFKELDDKIKQFIVNFGTCHPNGPFSKNKDQENSSFFLLIIVLRGVVSQ